MEITRLPPIQISTLQETVLSWRWIEGQTPVDFTATLGGVGWSVQFEIRHRKDAVFTATMETGAGGYLGVTVPRSIAEALRSCRRIDACFQITITAPLPELSEVWTGPVVVQEALQ